MHFLKLRFTLVTEVVIQQSYGFSSAPEFVLTGHANFRKKTCNLWHLDILLMILIRLRESH